jgi:hypothetical protein
MKTRAPAELGILVDRDGGVPAAIFSKPVQDRPTVFYEIIQRKGAELRQGQFQGVVPRPSSGSRPAGNLWRELQQRELSGERERLPILGKRSWGTVVAVAPPLTLGDRTGQT